MRFLRTLIIIIIIITRSVLARFGGNNWEKGEDFVKTFYVQKTCVGDGGELERLRAG